jgi:predicted SnoaL-like aldol condensation-catalyzing enzyme
MDVEERKKIAVKFVRMVAAGNPKEAAKRFFHPQCKHHNPYFPAGMDALTDGMIAADAGAARMAAAKGIDMNAPGAGLVIKHVLGDGNLVAVHSALMAKPGDPRFVQVHLFRFSRNKVVEYWDVTQSVLAGSLNTDGVF